MQLIAGVLACWLGSLCRLAEAVGGRLWPRCSADRDWVDSPVPLRAIVGVSTADRLAPWAWLSGSAWASGVAVVRHGRGMAAGLGSGAAWQRGSAAGVGLAGVGVVVFGLAVLNMAWHSVWYECGVAHRREGSAQRDFAECPGVNQANQCTEE